MAATFSPVKKNQLKIPNLTQYVAQGISYYLTTRNFRWRPHSVLCLPDFLLQKKKGMGCFYFSGKFYYIIQDLTSLKQSALIRTTTSVLILYLFLLTLDIAAWKVPPAFLVGLVNTETIIQHCWRVSCIKGALKRENMAWATADWQMQPDSSRRISFCPLKSKEVHQWKILVRKGSRKTPEGFVRLRDAARLWNPLHQVDMGKLLWRGVNAAKTQRPWKLKWYRFWSRLDRRLFSDE